MLNKSNIRRVKFPNVSFKLSFGFSLIVHWRKQKLRFCFGPKTKTFIWISLHLAIVYDTLLLLGPTLKVFHYLANQLLWTFVGYWEQSKQCSLKFKLEKLTINVTSSMLLVNLAIYFGHSNILNNIQSKACLMCFALMTFERLSRLFSLILYA